MDAREQDGKETSATAGVVDSQSVKTTEAGSLRGYDAGKKISGRKRHLITDTLGLPLNLAVHPASIQDRDGLALACRCPNGSSRGSPVCSPMAAIKAPSPPATQPPPGGGWRSSSDPIRPKASRSSQGAG
jgi:hypothetical protein